MHYRFQLGMQPHSPKTPQPEPENKFPYCLYMKLEGIPVQPDSQDYLGVWQPSPHIRQIDLHLTISFSEQWEVLKGGRVKFGLKGGELRLKLANSEIPFEDRELGGAVELSRQRKQSNPQARRVPKGRDIRLPPTNFPLVRGKSGASGQVGKVTKPSEPEPVKKSICHITTKVLEDNPVWLFEEEIGEPVLKGFLEKAKLATLKVTALPCSVEATFEVSKRDVCLTDAEGLWPPDISRNKRAVLERLIIQRLLEPKLKPYLSRAELHYD